MKQVLQAIKSLFRKLELNFKNAIEENSNYLERTFSNALKQTSNYVENTINELNTQVEEHETELNNKLDKTELKEKVTTKEADITKRLSVGTSNTLAENLCTTIGMYCKATNAGTLAVGYYAEATGQHSQAFGNSSKAIGDWSFAQGNGAQANGAYSYANGSATKSNGDYSHAEGYGTIASGIYQHAQGIANIEDTENKYLHIVGNGVKKIPPNGNGFYFERSNAHTIDWDGNGWFAGSVEGKALILTSPDGSRFNITVDDSGALTATKL